jgi:hypothetical protein
MASDEENDGLALILLALFVREWLVRYIAIEGAVSSSHRDILRRIEGIERRAVERYRSVISEFPVAESQSGTRIKTSRARLVSVKRAMESVFGPPMKSGGAIDRRLQVDMRKIARAARDAVNDYRASVGSMSKAFGVDVPGFDAGSIGAVQVLPQSEWAARRDIELIAQRAAHKASIGALGATNSGLLSRALSEAPRVTRIPRSSILNSVSGSEREVVRSTVHRFSNRDSAGWVEVRPYRGAPGSLNVQSESLLTARAARIARGDWRPGNPIGSYGMHVGSRTYFAPTISRERLLSVAAGVLLFVPDYMKRVASVASVPAYDRRNQAVAKFDGRRLNTIQDFVDSVSRALVPATSGAAPLPVPRIEMRRQIALTGQIRAIFDGTNPESGLRFIALSLDLGRDDGVEMDMVFEIQSPLPPPVIKGQATVIQLFPRWSTLLFEFGRRSERPEPFDFALTLGSRDQNA